MPTQHSKLYVVQQPKGCNDFSTDCSKAVLKVTITAECGFLSFSALRGCRANRLANVNVTPG